MDGDVFEKASRLARAAGDTLLSALRGQVWEQLSREEMHSAVALMYRRYAAEIESFMNETAPRVGPKHVAPRPGRRKPGDLFSAAR